VNKTANSVGDIDPEPLSLISPWISPLSHSSWIAYTTVGAHKIIEDSKMISQKIAVLAGMSK